MDTPKNHGARGPARGARETIDVELGYSPLDVSSPHSFPSERHPHFELIYVEKGLAQKTIGAHLVESRPGNVFFIPPDSFHRHGDPSQQATWSVRFHVEAVDGHLRGLLATLAIKPARARCYIVPEADRLYWEERLRYLRYELQTRRSPDADAVRVILRSILLDVAGLANVAQAESLRRTEIIGKVFGVIDERYREPIALRDVAAAVQLSPAYLTDLVRRETGKPVLQWITDRRMYAARMLLAETDIPVSAVAERVGFNDPSYFSRQFTRVAGKTPSSWRIASRRGSARAADDLGLPWNPQRSGSATAAELEAIRRLGEDLAALRGSDAIVRQSVATAFHALKPTLCQYVERDARDLRWRPRWAESAVSGSVELPEATDADGVLPLVIGGQTIVTQNLSGSPSEMLRRIGQQGFACSMIAPVRSDATCAGAIRVLERRPRSFSERERLLLATIGNLTGLALRCAQARPQA